MILLPKEFAERTDGCELLHYREVEFVENKFVPKKGHFHLFERSYANENRRHDRSVHSYEIFLASRHAKGSERYGKVYDDDTEYYPGKSYFGRGLAKCCGRLDLAQNYLQEIIEKCRKKKFKSKLFTIQKRRCQTVAVVARRWMRRALCIPMTISHWLNLPN